MNRGNWQVAIQYTRLQRVRHDLARAHTHTHTHSVDYNNSWLERLSHLCFPVELFLIYMSDSQSCPSLCDPMDCSLPGSFIHVILQARILEWVAISFRDLPNPGIEHRFPALQADSLLSEPPGKPTIKRHF